MFAGFVGRDFLRGHIDGQSLFSRVEVISDIKEAEIFGKRIYSAMRLQEHDPS